MKERPILFSGPMVRAILEGRKTQTRRILKPQPVGEQPGYYCDPYNKNYGHFTFWSKDNKMCNGQIGNVKGTCHWRPPYGLPGDRLWVRETFITGWPCHHGDEIDNVDENGNEKPIHVWYRADVKTVSQYGAPLGMWVKEDGDFADNIPWKPSIHMPRWASRITLVIVRVRVERLNDISEEDAKAEGVLLHEIFECHKDSFQHTWWSLNGPGSWEKNPWVWVIEFRRVAP